MEPIGTHTTVFVERLQRSLLPFVEITLLFLTILFLVLLWIYLTSIYLHAREERYILHRRKNWLKIIHTLSTDSKPLNDTLSLRKDRKHFQNLLIEQFSAIDLAGKERVRRIYEELGFLDEAIKNLKSRFWWKRAGAAERLGNLQYHEAEKHVLPLLRDKRQEVRYSAIRMLVSIKSDGLCSNLVNIFKDNSRWTYKYLIAVLFESDIPVSYLKALAESENRDLRKAAAILLGKKSNHAAIPVLHDLVDDDVADVRREAIYSLSQIGVVEAIPVFSRRVDDPDPQVRAIVAKSLGRFDDLKVLCPLEKLADDPDFDVRYQAFFSLYKLGYSGRLVFFQFKNKYPELVREFLSKDSNARDNS